MTLNLCDRQTCGMSCAECFQLGNAVVDWPRRRECKKLDARLLSSWESEGGVSVELDPVEAAPVPAGTPNLAVPGPC